MTMMDSRLSGQGLWVPAGYEDPEYVFGAHDVAGAVTAGPRIKIFSINK